MTIWLTHQQAVLRAEHAGDDFGIPYAVHRGASGHGEGPVRS